MLTGTLRLFSTAALVFRTYKLLKLSSAPAKTRTRAATSRQRRRNARELLICWIVWICFLWIEFYLDFYVAWAVPLYSQVKFFIMAFLALTRSHSARPLFDTYVEPVFISNYIGETLEILEGLLTILGKYMCKAVSSIRSYLRPSTWKMFSSKSNGFWSKNDSNIIIENNNTVDQVSKHPYLSSSKNKTNNNIIKNIPANSSQDAVVTPIYRNNPNTIPQAPLLHNDKLPGHFDFSFNTPVQYPPSSSHHHQPQQSKYMSTPTLPGHLNHRNSIVPQSNPPKLISTSFIHGEIPQENNNATPSSRRYSASSEARQNRYRKTAAAADVGERMNIKKQVSAQNFMQDEKSFSSISSGNVLMVSNGDISMQVDDESIIDANTSNNSTSVPVRMIAGVVIEPSPAASSRRKSSQAQTQSPSQLRDMSSTIESPSRRKRIRQSNENGTLSSYTPPADSSNNSITTKRPQPSTERKSSFSIENGGTRPLRFRTISSANNNTNSDSPENKSLSHKRKRVQTEDSTANDMPSQHNINTTLTTVETASDRPRRRRKVDSENEDISSASKTATASAPSRRRTTILNGHGDNNSGETQSLTSGMSTRSTRRTVSSSSKLASKPQQQRHFLAPPLSSKSSSSQSQNNPNNDSIGPVRSHNLHPTTSRNLRKPQASASLEKQPESVRNKSSTIRIKRASSNVPSMVQTRSSSSVRSK